MKRAYELHQAQKLGEAMAIYREVLHANPRHYEALYLLGVAHLQRGEAAEAERLLGGAVAINPRSLGALHWHGSALTMLGRPVEAIADFDRALALKPDLVETLVARGHACMQLRRPEDALGSYDIALTLKPGTPELLYNRANALSILHRYEAAIADCEELLAVQPDYPYARGILVHSKMNACDWRGLGDDKAKVAAALMKGARAISPFNHKALSDSAEEQLRCARAWVANEVPPAPPVWKGERYTHSRIRLAYISADFNISAVATLMAGVFERHDRARFETIAISFGATDKTPMRQRLESAFDRFIDVRGRTDSDIAAIVRGLEADIAVDLMGYTGECRTGIVARRPAPIQVNYLGFPGTMGAPYIDYIVADSTIIPSPARQHYAERVAYLPNYFPNDCTRAIGKPPSRADAGLPEKAFVFASFNNAYKFNAATFDIWMRLLAAVPGSVLWLPRGGDVTLRNLTREAQERGIARDRLVFAPKIPGDDAHLARLSLADLFLDTLPYNAHTTASDALWAGVPLITCEGQSFAARVAASQLRALNIPELIASTLGDYEALALGLAREPAALAAIRAKLAQNRRTAALFDTALYTRNLEAAFAAMHERHRMDLPPASFAVEPGGASVTLLA